MSASSVSQFTPLNSVAAWGKLNGHLGRRSYVVGFQASAQDLDLFAQIPEAPESRWVHVLRWYRHIAALADHHESIRKIPGSEPVASQIAPSAKTSVASGGDDDDDVDLFGDETAEERDANAARRARAAAAPAKAAPVGRSVVVLDVKPWGEDVDLAELERMVREIGHEGLEWKASQLEEVAYGIKKLRIACHVVDDLVAVEEDVIASIESLEDHVQSVDICSFSKL